jgi:hypothetical protein
VGNVVAVVESNKTYETIIQSIKQNVNITQTYQLIGAKETNWYKHTSKIFDQLVTVHGVDKEDLKKYIIYHNLDTLPFPEKMVLVVHLFPGEEPADVVEKTVKQYFLDRFIESKTKRGVYLVNGEGLLKSYIQTAGVSSWPMGSTNDEIEFAKAKSLNKFKIPTRNFADMLGLMVIFKKQMVFKMRDVTQKRNTGAHCESAGKVAIIKVLNRIIGDTVYTDENTEPIYKIGLCAMTELLLRENTRTKKDDKHWFLEPEQAIFSK